MAVATKRKAETDSPDSAPQTPAKIQKTTTAYAANTSVKRTPGGRRRADPPAGAERAPTAAPAEDMRPQLARIAASTGTTPFQRRVLALLCQVPRGRVTTYGLLSRHLGSSPRAVGSAMRRNPFAPAVPCHRVVAAGGGLGGFKGEWPRGGEGVTLDEKRVLLRGEGVKFDGKGRVVGTPFDGFA